MPKINFNIPFVSETGEPLKQLKLDPDKIVMGQNGQPVAQPIRDEEGNIVQETMLVKNLLARVLNMTFPGDENVSFGDKVKRGKLARKVQTNSSAHYTDAEIEIITDLTGKAGSTVLIAQLDDLLTGKIDDSEAA